MLDTIIKNSGKILAAIVIVVVIITLATVYRLEKYGANPRVVTLYYTNWCGHCARMKPIWEQVRAACKGRGIVFVESDEEKNTTPGIDSYPTIIMITEQGVTEKYHGRPDFGELHNWIIAVRPRW